MPSTHTVNCPSPSGMCASMYYMLGNDPGQPGQLNLNYNPQYRTIGASFEIWPGQMLPSDLAPTQMVVGVLNSRIDPDCPGRLQPSDDARHPNSSPCRNPIWRVSRNDSFDHSGPGLWRWPETLVMLGWTCR